MNLNINVYDTGAMMDVDSVDQKLENLSLVDVDQLKTSVVDVDQ